MKQMVDALKSAGIDDSAVTYVKRWKYVFRFKMKQIIIFV
jgi:hypothetical protein